MKKCFVCGDTATFTKENGGWYMCRQCIHDGKDLE